MSDDNREKALKYHRFPTPGKLRIEATTPLTSQNDLTLAYSPGLPIPASKSKKIP